jgi:hypothetical protein
MKKGELLMRRLEGGIQSKRGASKGWGMIGRDNTEGGR